MVGVADVVVDVVVDVSVVDVVVVEVSLVVLVVLVVVSLSVVVVVLVVLSVLVVVVLVKRFATLGTAVHRRPLMVVRKAPAGSPLEDMSSNLNPWFENSKPVVPDEGTKTTKR